MYALIRKIYNQLFSCDLPSKMRNVNLLQSYQNLVMHAFKHTELHKTNLEHKTEVVIYYSSITEAATRY